MKTYLVTCIRQDGSFSETYVQVKDDQEEVVLSWKRTDLEKLVKVIFNLVNNSPQQKV